MSLLMILYKSHYELPHVLTRYADALRFSSAQDDRTRPRKVSFRVNGRVMIARSEICG